MPLNLPQLDDRSYQELLDDALKRIRADLDTDWTDLSAGDPGVVLLETFAFLTEQMLYRLNRLPEKAYIAFLRMLGVGLRPPYAASVKLSFWQDPAGEKTVQVPRGTVVTSESRNGEPVVFTTVQDLDVPPDCSSLETAATAIAYHATWVEEDLTPLSNGAPGQVFTVKRPPILGNAKGLKMVLGTEIPASEWQADDWIVSDQASDRDVIRHFRIWQEVQNFAGLPDNAHVYRLDRQEGIIQFAPAVHPGSAQNRKEVDGQNDSHSEAQGKKALAAVPQEGCVIRVRYATGGGTSGNIPAGILTVIQGPPLLKTQIRVTNKEPARGGMDTETLEHALVRGPQEIFTQERLVTARDFERRVLRFWPNIARARAYALQDLWEHAVPGTVGINLVPALAGPCTKEALEAEQGRLEEAKDRVAKELRAESPLGIRTQLNWARYKRVSVSVVAAARLDEQKSAEDVRQYIQDMLYRFISPLPSPASPPKGNKKPDTKEKELPAQNGWSFGAELYLAEVSRRIFESGQNILMLPTLELKLDSAPDKDVSALAVDYFQANTWYAASGMRLFRTTNNAAGWEELLDFSPGMSNPSLHLQEDTESLPDGQSIRKVCPSPNRAGLVALSALKESADPVLGTVYLSTDCGENWLRLTDMDAEIYDMDWLRRAEQHILLLATSRGLKELHIEFDKQGDPHLKNSYPIPVIDLHTLNLPVYSVKVMTGGGGASRVAVAMSERRGVYISNGIDLHLSNGSAFALLRTEGNEGIPPDIRCLGVQRYEADNRYLLWAGSMAIGPVDPGDGCCRWIFNEELKGPLETGRWFRKGWAGGSCLGLDFQGDRVLAATARGSILVADVQLPTRDELHEILHWTSYDEQDVLPLRTPRFEELSPTAHEEHVAFTAIATNGRLKKFQEPLVLAGCGKGVFRSRDNGVTFEKTSRGVFRNLTDAVTIPPNWVMVSGTHNVTVEPVDKSEDQGGRKP